MLINRVNSSRTSSTQTPIRLQFVNQSQFIKKIVAKIAWSHSQKEFPIMFLLEPLYLS